MRPRRLAALLLALAVGAGGCSSDEYVAPTPERREDAARPAVASQTVAALQEAVAAGDEAAASALGADDAAAERLEQLARNARLLRLDDVTFRYVTETGRTGDDGAWDGTVAVTWRHGGFDEASARREVSVSFADGGSRIAGVGAGGDALPVWLSGPVVVRRTPESVTFGPVDAAETARYAGWARRAVAQAREALGGRPRLVVEVPADDTALHRALDVPQGEYAAIAAVTAPVDGSRAPGSPVHVFVNPTVYDELDPIAAQVVMTHEAVHAVTGAVLSRQAPLWLVEGFADHVALRDVALPLRRTAGQVLGQVRKDGLPDALPSQADFDTGSGHLGAAYEAAWLVCVTLASRGGEQALAGLHRAVLDGKDLAAELRSRFDWSEADLVAAWRDRLARAAGTADAPG